MNNTALNPTQLVALLTHTIPAGLPVLIQGAPGIGKSDIVAQAAEACNARLLIEHPVVSDPTDAKGLPYAFHNPETQRQEAHFLPFHNLQQLIDATSLTVCFLDDLGQAPPATQAAYMQLILARQINGFKVSDHVCFIAATNRRQDKAGVSGILEPVKSRFTTIVELTPDLDSWTTWALAAGLPMEVIAFIRFRPGLLHDFKPSADLVNTPSPRTVHNVAKLLTLSLPVELEYPTIAGAAGEGFAAEFLGFLQIYRSLPNIDAILLNPTAGDVPQDPATLYALAGALARKASPTNFDAVTSYACRMPAEFSVCLVKDAITMKPELCATKSFITWSTKHKDVLI